MALQIGGTQWDVQFKRMFAAALDSTEVWTSYNDAVGYAANREGKYVPYAGQIVSVTDGNGAGVYKLVLSSSLTEEVNDGRNHYLLEKIGGLDELKELFTLRDNEEKIEKVWEFLKGLRVKEELNAEDIKTETLTIDKGEDEPQDGGKTYVQSSGYVRGGKGFGIYKDANGAWGMDIENLEVRGSLSVNELHVNMTEYLGGEVLLTVGGSIEATEVILLEDGGWKVRFKNSDDNGREIRCMMKAGDLAKHQTWNEKDGLHYYWLEVTGVGDDFITLKQLAGDTTKYSEPQVGDEIVHLGNKKDKERQGALIFSARTQSMRIWTGINTTSLSSANDPIDLNPVQSKILAKFITMSTGETLDTAFTDIVDRMGVLIDDVDMVKNQYDKQFVIWFIDYIPTLTNAPYTDWIADGKDERDMHLGDACYNISTDVSSGGGRAWHFKQDEGGNYYWREITDKDTLRALEAAAKAQDTADGKRRVFVVNTGETPVPPYDEGDMWANATFSGNGVKYDNDTLVVKKGVHKAEGESFNIADWKPASCATSAYLAQLGDQIIAFATNTNDSLNDIRGKVTAAQNTATQAVNDAAQGIGLANIAQSTADNAMSALSVTNKNITALVNGGYLNSDGTLKASAQSLIDIADNHIAALSKKITFDSSGKITNISKTGLVQTSEFITLFNQQVSSQGLVNSATLNIFKNEINAKVDKIKYDSDGNITNISKSGLVLSGDFGTLFAQQIDPNNLATTAYVTTTVNNGISSAIIKADHIKLEGHVTANGNFKVLADGSIEAVNGKFTGEINATSGVFEYCTIGRGCRLFSENGWNLYGDSTGAAWQLQGRSQLEILLNLEYTGAKSNKLLLRNAPSNGNSMIEIVTHQSNGIRVDTDNTGIRIVGNSVTAVPLDVTGNVRLKATRSGEHVSIQGIALNVRTISSGGTIVSSDDVVVFTNTSSITVMLPPASDNKGKIFYMKKKGSGGVTVTSSFGAIMAANGTSTSESNGDVNSGRSMMFISDGTYWISYFCG